jgi:hypothetical protein
MAAKVLPQIGVGLVERLGRLVIKPINRIDGEFGDPPENGFRQAWVGILFGGEISIESGGDGVGGRFRVARAARHAVNDRTRLFE